MIKIFFFAVCIAWPTTSYSFARAQDESARREYLRGTLLERRGDSAAALDAYEKALALDPNSAFLAGEAAELALEMENLERAERWSARRLELAPQDAKSHLLRAQLAWAKGDEKTAIDSFDAALALDPAELQAILSLAELLAAKDPERARVRLAGFMKKNPDHSPRILYEIGKLDAQERRWGDAVKNLRRAIELDDATSDPARLALGQVLETSSDVDGAIAEYRHVLTSSPDDHQLSAHIAELEAARGDRDAARREFKRLLAARPGDQTANSWLAADAEAESDFAAAAAYLKSGEGFNDDPALHLRLSYYQTRAGDERAAMKTLTQAHLRWPRDTRVSYFLALGYDDAGKRRQAIELLRELLAVKPDDRDARWQLATLLDKMGDTAGAEKEFRRLLVDEPDDAPTLNYLGYVLADKGLKLDESEAMIRRALILEPANAAYRDSLAWVLFQQHRSTEAMKELEASIASFPNDAVAWEHLAAMHSREGRTKEAWLAARRAQSLGSRVAEKRAQNMEGTMSRENRGELWRLHLESTQGRLMRYGAVCALSTTVGGRKQTHQAMITYQEPRRLTLELLGPLLSPIWKASLRDSSFEMDPFPIAGVDPSQAEDAVQGVLSIVLQVLSGDPFSPGEARYLRRWWKDWLLRPGWRVRLKDGLAEEFHPTDRPVIVELSDFEHKNRRAYPHRLSVKARSWEMQFYCAEPKVEAQ